MATTAPCHFEVDHASPRIGAIVRADKETLLSGARAAEIREIMERRGVIVFPEINLTDAEQIAFTHTLGTFAREASEYGASGDKSDTVYPITMDSSINPNADYLKGAFYWHIDGTMAQVPILASIMSSRALSAPGTGDTEFCNTYAAWDDLPEAEKAAIEGLEVDHAMWRSQLYYNPEPTIAQLRAWQGLGVNRLPLVWKHRSGRKSLVLGCTALQVAGMDMSASEELLVRLRDWATQPQFVYRHTWQLGDMVIWDNTRVLHEATGSNPEQEREIHRTTIKGELCHGWWEDEKAA